MLLMNIKVFCRESKMMEKIVRKAVYLKDIWNGRI